MKSSRRATSHDAGSWKSIAARAQRLARLQLAVLLAFVALATTLSTFMGLQWRELAGSQSEITRTLHEIEELEHAAQDGVRWALLRTSTPPPDELRTLLRDGETKLAAILGEDSTGVEEGEGEIVEQIVQALDRAEAVVLDDQSGPRAGVRDDDVALLALVELTDAIEEWIHFEEEELSESALSTSADATRLMWTLIGAIGAAAAILLILWWYLARHRHRLVRSLGHAVSRLAQRAERDQLTGLLGHAAFKEHLTESFKDAQERGTQISLAIFDIDSFKALNDTYGHQFGDRVIEGVGRTLSASCREGEFAGRLGGDEFGWVIVGAVQERALLAAERVRHSLGLIEGIPLNLVSASCGVCSIGLADDPDELYRFADGALYWAKEQGRKNSVLYNPHEVWDLSAKDHANRVQREVKLDSVLALAKAIDARDPSTLQHSERVADMSARIARQLGWTDDQIDRLVEAAYVHDVGKIGVPDSILFKPGRLDADEYEIVKGHSELGAQILDDLLTREQVAWVRGHHERMDGLGYPDGLAGDEIAEGARIIALADSWDAMTSERPHATPKGLIEALEECHRCAGSQFWPEAVAALERVVSSDDLRQPSNATAVHATH